MVKQLSCGLFPVPFQDETCYSLLCRYAVRRGQYSSNQICLELFEHVEPLDGYMFKPFRVRDIHRWFSDGPEGFRIEYGTCHSCYPYYIAFLKAPDAEKVKGCQYGYAFSSGQAKRINRKCGFSKAHKKNLWYCPDCVREDIDRYGETCWRRYPQMPGVVCCPLHHRLLCESSIGFQDIRYHLVPATYAVFHRSEPKESEENKGPFFDQYVALAADIVWLLDNGFLIPNEEWMDQNYYEYSGRRISEYKLYDESQNSSQVSQFGDSLINRIIKDSGKESIYDSVIRQISSILAVESVAGSLADFCSILAK